VKQGAKRIHRDHGANLPRESVASMKELERFGNSALLAAAKKSSISNLLFLTCFTCSRLLEPRHPRHQVDDVGLLERLGQVVVEPCLAGLAAILFLAVAGDRH
jgi:hypothetical protein